MAVMNSTLAGIQKIERGPLREQVRTQIKQLILTNHMRPGQAIVIDRLAAELGVSHTPVREALAMLQHDGLVQMRPYGNPIVAEVTESDVCEAWEMRVLLEGWVVRQAALTLTDDELHIIEQALDLARADARLWRYDSHFRADVLFHDMIMHSKDHKLFSRLSQMVSDQSTRIRWLVEAIAPADEVLTIINEHYAILRALQARQPEQAQEQLVAHLRAGMGRTLSALKSMQEEGEKEKE
jgi:DNA-binding GntR family transcriptional regulator